MRRFSTALTAALAVVALGSMVLAQPAAKPAATEKKIKTVAVKTVKTMSVTGMVTKFDEATRTLTVGEKEFTLGANAKITAGAKAATTADLAGRKVKVTYTTVEGKHVASKVTLAPEAKPKAEKQAEAKTEKK